MDKLYNQLRKLHTTILLIVGMLEMRTNDLSWVSLVGCPATEEDGEGNYVALKAQRD